MIKSVFMEGKKRISLILAFVGVLSFFSCTTNFETSSSQDVSSVQIS